MKKACVVIYCLAWLLPVCSFEDVFSAELVSMTRSIHQALRRFIHVHTIPELKPR